MTRSPSRTLRRAGAAATVLTLALSLAACGDETDDDAAAGDPETSASEPAADDLPEWAPAIETDADGGVTGLDFADTPEPGDELEVHVVSEGDGPALEVGQNLTADYFGAVYDAAEPFDESYSSKPFSAAIGVGQLIPGWDQALPGIPLGSRVLLSIPSDLGYGDAGSPPAIPGGATLFFVLDLIDAQ